MNRFKKISIIILGLPLILFSCKKSYSNYIVACVGDSITWGYEPITAIQLETPYPEALKSALGFGRACNYGVSGSTLCNGKQSYAPMVDRLDRVSENVNLIIIMGGSNDVSKGCDFGEESSRDSNNVTGAIYNICDKITHRFPNAFKMFITPLPVKKSAGPLDLSNLQQTIIKTCANFNIPVLDFYKESEFEKEWDQPYSDGIHPSQKFVIDTMVPKIANFIKQNVK